MRSETVSTKLHQLSEQARRHPERVFTTLHHLIDVEFLHEAFLRLRKNAASGVDNMTAAEYAEGLADRLSDLHLRVHENRYRAQPVRRVWIAKEDGKRRPLGVRHWRTRFSSARYRWCCRQSMSMSCLMYRMVSVPVVARTKR